MHFVSTPGRKVAVRCSVAREIMALQLLKYISPKTDYVILPKLPIHACWP